MYLDSVCSTSTSFQKHLRFYHLNIKNDKVCNIPRTQISSISVCGYQGPSAASVADSGQVGGQKHGPWVAYMVGLTWAAPFQIDSTSSSNTSGNIVSRHNRYIISRTSCLMPDSRYISPPKPVFTSLHHLHTNPFRRFPGEIPHLFKFPLPCCITRSLLLWYYRRRSRYTHYLFFIIHTLH